MISDEPLPSCGRLMRQLATMIAMYLRGVARAAERLLLAAACPAAGVASAPAVAADKTLKAGYIITIAGITIGKANAEGRFTDTGYAATISGSTYGISRFVSDAQAVLAGNGRIRGTHVLPATYNLETSEKGFQTHVSMAMRGGSIVDLTAAPHLLPAPDRVPVTPDHKRNVVDPVGAFVVAVNRARTVGRRQRLQSHGARSSTAGSVTMSG